MIRNLILKSSKSLNNNVLKRTITTTTRGTTTTTTTSFLNNRLNIKSNNDRIHNYCTKNNNNNKKDKNLEKKQEEPSIYGNIGDIDFSKKQSGPSITSSMTKEQLSKSLLLMRKSGTLSSVNMMAKMENEDSTPVYGSLSPYALFDDMEEVAGDIGNPEKKEMMTIYNPIIALKNSSPHIKHFKHFTKVSLVVYPLTPVGRSPSEYDLPRINFSGRMIRLSETDDKLKYNKAKRLYFEKHPKSESIIENGNASANAEQDGYQFYIMEISDIYYYERNSKLNSIPLEVFKCARSDSITIQSREIIETVNSKYQDSLSLIVEQYGDVKLDDCFMYLIDSYGLNCIGKKKGIDEWLDIRIPFDTAFDTFENCKTGLYETLKSIRNKSF